MSILTETSTSSQLFDNATSKIMCDDTMIELQIELKGAVALATELKSENDDLQRQLESHIAFSNANLQRHAEWKNVWKKEREVVSMREKQLEMDEANWKVKLEERRKEMAEIDRKMNDNGVKLPGGAGLLDLMKNIQIEHQNKIERLINEASSWREECYGCRKSYGELEARHEELQGRFDRERYAAESFEKEIASLQQSLFEQVNWNDRNDTASPSSLEVNLARDLKMQLDEKDLLLHELISTRKARDDALCSNDELSATHQREHTKLIEECARLEAKNQTLERRIKAATEALAQAKSSKSELEETMRKNDKELARVRNLAVVQEEEYATRLEQLGQERSQYELQLKKLDALLVEEKKKSKMLEHQCIESQDHAMKQISDLAKNLKHKNDSEEKLLVAQDHISKLENSITDLQSEMKRHTLSQQTEVERLQHACESCYKDLSLVLLEKKEADKVAAEVRAKSARSQKLFEDSESLALKLENGQQALRIEFSDKINNMNNENEALREKLRCALESVCLLKDQASSEQEKAVGALRREVERVTHELHKEKSRSEAYKSKALEAHLRSVKAKEVLDSLCNSK